ncbi:hypothetical protein ACUXCC_004885 [Cytobacillus horneckiae]|uniref:Uncharacterized protein n=1 Tax=Cytobacillus horneckiae TaxID=549687 RepID=A0A2N0ZCF1_9BACI|nr:hypothetical protein [Cytobacillus horneckiae]NRG48396.1 hypothetical protein [Bacillus sp. CRN 9]MBN6889582.1 hypothetical protein [Cytobacillus horneckiae]MCM3180947.1 hypothetical protein [Cytobacillus horneckiae]MEC1158115.1 hypothetical protein [Cytobacillus horneckiae]MED2936386.1 hypothetical protein [Cytobacillus horneckiae]
MVKKKQLIEQIKVVINKLEEDNTKDLNSGVLQLIYIRYKKALEILENNEDIKGINILGGVRAYMDSYNDYQNPLLGELHKAEKIIKELL